MKSHAPRTGVLLLAVVLLLQTSGCGGKLLPLAPHPEAPAASLPEWIYQQPQHNTYTDARVGIFRFSAPINHSDVGYNAANSLYQALVKHNIFHTVTSELNTWCPDLVAQLETARDKGYDLIITGRVGYYLDGTLYQESRVDAGITVYDVTRSGVVWHAIATAASRPQPGKDYYLHKTKGQRPLPPAALIEMNTEKFINMLAATPASP